MDQAIVDAVSARVGEIWIVLAIFGLSFILFFVLLVSVLRALRKEITSLGEGINDLRDTMDSNDQVISDDVSELLNYMNEQEENYKNIIFRLSIMEERLDMRQMTLDYKVKRGPGRPPKEE